MAAERLHIRHAGRGAAAEDVGPAGQERPGCVVAGPGQPADAGHPAGHGVEQGYRVGAGRGPGEATRDEQVTAPGQDHLVRDWRWE